MKTQKLALMRFVLLMCILALVGGTGILQARADSTIPPEPPNKLPVGTRTGPPSQVNSETGTWDWYDGVAKYSTILNCIGGYSEYGAAAYVGIWANPDDKKPAVNSVYYVHVVIYGLGNPCAGTLSLVEIGLPPSTNLAISATNPVYCYWDGAPISPPSDCPQSLPASVYNPGFYTIPSPGSSQTWPLPQGHNWEFQVPVKSSTALSAKTLTGATWMLDGNSSPWLYPTALIYVFGIPKPGAFNKTSPVNNAKGISWGPTLKWGASLKATKYEYCIDKINNNKCDSYWKSTGLNKSVTLSGLLHGKLYYWQVRAKNSGGTTIANNGTWWHFTTKP